MNKLDQLLDTAAVEFASTQAHPIGSGPYELAKTRLARMAPELAKELRARLTDERDAARLLDIDPPEPGSPLARAFAANAALRKERDAAYRKGRSDARKEILGEIDKLRAHFVNEPCDCPRMAGFSGPHCRGDIGCRYRYEARQ